MIMPRPLSGCQIKAEIKGFLLRYRLFQYKHWFFPYFELKDFPEYTFTPCKSGVGFEIWTLLSFMASFDLSNLGGQMENIKFYRGF